MPIPRFEDAVISLAPKAGFSFRGEVIEKWDMNDTKVPQPPEDEIRTRLAELQAAYPLQELRRERNQLLAESDWIGLSDTALTNEKSAEWKLYRQKLRNLPDGLDTVDKVNAVTWPTKPE